MFVTAQITDLVVTGLSKRKMIHVISSQWQEVSQRIMNDLKRGVTVIPARGGFSGEERPIIYTVVTFRCRASKAYSEVD
jgi:uncharacterized membrane-anchored protein YitT (DUF2179 family)